MHKTLPVYFLLVLLAACSTSSPIITANPDQANSMSGTTGSSPATDRMPPKSTDTLSAPKDSTVRLSR